MTKPAADERLLKAEPLSRITAPYGFVPLSPKVVRPNWMQPRIDAEGLPIAPPLQDRPFLDGVSGSLVLELEAETPIFSRGTSDTQRSFQLPGGSFAIPATTLKGNVRNVIEIATFSRLGRVNDHRYAVRDLNNRDLYGRFMADIIRNPKTGKTEPAPLVNAGWLSRDSKDNYTITVCDFAKIEYELIGSLAQRLGIQRFEPGRKQSSVDKYAAWGGASREVTVTAQLWRPDVVGNRRIPSRYGKVTALGGTMGTLVFTGQPAEYRPDRTRSRRGGGNAKHHDFVFLSPTGSPSRAFPVSPDVFRDFEFAHSDRGQQNKLGRSEAPNAEWKYWREQLEKGSRVPVFFLADATGDTVQNFGLAMMFRLPYRNSVGGSLARIHPPVEAALDFAEGLFGTVSESGRRRGNLALKGRVAFSHAIGENVRELEAVRVVLGAPRASYYPNYVEQDPDVPGAQPPAGEYGARYTTWQDDFGRPRGWKRYRPLTETWTPQPPTGVDGKPLNLEKVGTTFRPLAAGARFRSTVTLHNLRPIELGALLWALDFGGNTTARHTLGMARPLGYGRVRMRITAVDVRGIDGTPANLDAARAAFVAYMEMQIPGWGRSIQIEALLNLAQPVAPSEARYQRLDPGKRINEFVDAKKAGLALPAAHRVTGTAAMRVSAQRSVAPPPRFSRETGPTPRRGRPARPDAPARPAVPVARRGWPGMRRGDSLRVRLVELNKKGKWRAKAAEHDAIGTIEGTPPADAVPGQEHIVEVIQGGDPRNLNLKWKGI